MVGWTMSNPSGKNNSLFKQNGDSKHTGSYGIQFSSYTDNGVNTQYLISPELNAPNGGKVTFYYKNSKSGYAEVFKVGYSTTDNAVSSFTWGDEMSKSDAAWEQYEGSFPAGTKYVAVYYYSNYQYYLYVDDFCFTAAASGPALEVADGSTPLSSGYKYNFGLTTAGTTKEFKLSNPGTESITLNIEATNGFGVSPSNVTIAAKGETTLTVTMADATASCAVTITPTAGGVDAFTVNVSGVILDEAKMYEDFSGNALPEDWTTASIGGNAGSWNFASGYARYTSTSYESYLNNYKSALVSPENMTFSSNEEVIFKVKKDKAYNTYASYLLVQYWDGDSWEDTEEGAFDDAALPSDFQWESVTIPSSGTRIRFVACGVSIDDIYGGELPKVAKMVVTQPTSLDFGLFDKDATPAPTKTFTIANTGKATLNGINVTSGNAAFTITDAPTSLAAGASQTVTITMATGTTGALSSLITVSATDMQDVKFTVSGVVMPAGVEVIDFNDNKLPSGWGNDASNKWSFSDGKAYCTSAAELTTPQLLFEEGDFFIIKATSYDDYDNNYIEITGSSDGTTWSLFDTKKFISRSQIPYGSYANLVVTGIPTTCKYLNFKGYYVRIDEIAGLKLSNDAPVLGYYTDSECTAAATATVTKNFDFVTEAPAAQVYYIKNDGTGTMSISLGDVPTGFTAALGKASLTAGEKTTLTINMPAETKGYHNGNIVVTAKNSSDESIGTFTVKATGVVIEEGKLNVNFKNAVDQRPTGWTGWTVTPGDNGYIYSGTSVSNLLTTTLTAAAGGEKLVIAASGDKSSYSYPAELKVYTKTGDADWSDAIDLTSNLLSTSTWYTLAINVPEGDNLIKFEGKNVYIQRIYGLTAVAVPFMETTAANIAFGMQTAESAEQTFTISNTGEAPLTGLSVTLDKTGDDAEYEIRMTDSEDAAFSSTTLAAGATITVHVKQLFDLEKLGSKSDVLRIAATGQTPVVINLTGATRNPAILYVDFDDPNAFPEGWQAGTNWSVYTYGADRYAYQSSSKISSASALVTTPLTMEEGKTLSFKVSKNGSGYGYETSLKVRYSQNGGATWSEYVSYPKEGDIDSGWKTIEIDDLPTGDLIVEFFGNNIKLDMIQGLKTATAPALALTEGGAAVVNGSTKAFENLKAAGVATYTLKNIGNDAMVSTVSITGGATAVISGEGEGVTLAKVNDSETYNKVTLAAGKSATITLTVPFAAPYDDMSGAMTITTEGWVGDFAVNYNATLVDPTDFVEDFTTGKPTGWYSDGWTYSTYYGNAYSYNGVNKPMITEKIEATSTKNVLSFDAKVYYGDDDQTLNVYTSTDRKNWSAVQAFTVTSTVQTFSLDALADGEYYVKFEAANVAIDNVKGVKRILPVPTHDLYVTATNFPATTTKGNNATISATVTNLRADNETGVYAKLFINGAETQTADAQDIALNGTKTFSFTYVIPENKTAQIKVYFSGGTEAFATAENDMKVNYTFDEEVDPSTITAGTFDVTLNRSFVAGWNTICLPFAVTDIEGVFGDGVKIYGFDSKNGDNLRFTSVDETEAGTPYLIKMPAAKSDAIVMNNANISATTAGSVEKSSITLYGSYAPMAEGSLDGYYGVNSENKIAPANGSTTMKGFRAYFSGSVAGARISIFDETTGITTVYGADKLFGNDNRIYNLKGQHVENAKKGIYIVNGKKVVIK